MYNQKQKELMISMTLGDGSICFINGSYYLSIGHGELQEDYVSWKGNILNSAFHKNYKVKMRNIKNQKLKKTYKQFEYRFFSKNLKEIYEELYINGKKTISSNMLKDIKSDLSLAIWFMDDGSVFKRKRKHKDGSVYYDSPTLKLCTHCFSYEENILICDWFKRKYLIEPRITSETKKGKTYYYIYFIKNDSKKIFDLCKRYIIQIPSMIKKFSWFFEFYNYDTSIKAH